MLSPSSKRRSAPHALLFLTLALAWGAFVAASPALAQPQWSYVYHANAQPNALPGSDAWTKQRLTGGRSRPTIENGRLRVSTAGQLQYVRGESVDPVLGQGELTIEVRSRTSASPVWGLVVGNTFNLGGSGRSSIGAVQAGPQARPEGVCLDGWPRAAKLRMMKGRTNALTSGLVWVPLEDRTECPRSYKGLGRATS